MRAKPLHILIADDDAALRRTLRSCLAAHGYEITEARSGEETMREMARRPADAILLDIEMGGMNGLEVCKRLRSLLPHAGIVMVTDYDAEDSKIHALEAGADDCVSKPFSLRELIARLRALTRRRLGQPGTTLLRVGELELDLDRRSLRRAGVDVHLSPIELDLLAYLMAHADAAVEHGRLLRAVWGPEYGSELEYLRTYVKRLRKKIETDALNPEFLVTVPWLGYCLRDRSRTARAPREMENYSSVAD
jgi:two-component system, OmpR family, KDP operon response regulator KdpE